MVFIPPEKRAKPGEPRQPDLPGRGGSTSNSTIHGNFSGLSAYANNPAANYPYQGFGTSDSVGSQEPTSNDNT